MDGRPVVFKKKDKPSEETINEFAQQLAIENAKLEMERQAMMANLTAPTYTTYGGQFNTTSITAGSTYTTSSYTGNSPWPNSVQWNNLTAISVDPDKYVSPYDAAYRVMELSQTFRAADMKPSIRGKRFNHYGLEWRMI